VAETAPLSRTTAFRSTSADRRELVRRHDARGSERERLRYQRPRKMRMSVTITASTVATGTKRSWFETIDAIGAALMGS